jgi:hypothetical protein
MGANHRHTFSTEWGSYILPPLHELSYVILLVLRAWMSHTLAFTVRLRIQPAKLWAVGLLVQFMPLATSLKLTTVPPNCNGPLTLRNSLGPWGVVRARQELIWQLSTFSSTLCNKKAMSSNCLITLYSQDQVKYNKNKYHYVLKSN